MMKGTTPAKGCLLYCIFRKTARPVKGPPCGVDRQPVSIVSAGALCAAISRKVHPELKPSLPCIKAHERVVEFFHASRTVIPMRFGAACASEPRVRQFLEEQQTHYLALLGELEGCVEMGLRCLLPPEQEPSPHPADARQVAARAVKDDATARSGNSGRAYLDVRKVHYLQEEGFSLEKNAVIEACKSAFEGLFRKCKTESGSCSLYPSKPPAQLLSLYFLVPKPSASRFRRAFRAIPIKKSVRLLLSGPWPPYNFCAGTAENPSESRPRG